MLRVLVIDNYDSFVYTLNGYLRQLGAETDVVRNDDIAGDELPAKLAENGLEIEALEQVASSRLQIMRTAMGMNG